MEKRICAVGVVEFKGRYLICKMPKDRGVYPGQWAIPGGGIDAGETMEEGLVREIREEVGIDITNIRPFHFSDDTKVKKFADGDQRELYMVFLVFLCEAVDDKVKLNEEFEEYKWVTLLEVDSFDLNAKTVTTFEILKKYKKAEVI